jgi:tetratricopeptide (TPR) repeat protein
MINPNDILTNKISLLLKEFFSEPQIEEIIGTPKSISQPPDQPPTKQFDISADSIKQRKFIDRVITYAKSNLDKNVCTQLLLELVNLLAESENTNLAEEILINSMNIERSNPYYAESLLATADIFIRKAFWDNSISLIKNARESFARLNNISGLARCENLLGILHGERGDLIKSRGHFLNSRNLLDHNSDKKFAAQIETNIGIIENIIGNFIKAEKYFRQALNKFESLNDQKNVAEIRHNLGMYYFEQKEYNKALIEFDKGIAIALRENYKSILAISYLGRANALLCLENYNESSEYCYMALGIAINIEDKLTIADVYRTIGILERKLKQYDTAEKYFRTSIRLNDELDNKLNSAETSFEVGLLYHETGREVEKNRWMQKSLKYYQGVGANDKAKMVENFLQLSPN